MDYHSARVLAEYRSMRLRSDPRIVAATLHREITACLQRQRLHMITTIRAEIAKLAEQRLSLWVKVSYACGCMTADDYFEALRCAQYDLLKCIDFDALCRRGFHGGSGTTCERRVAYEQSLAQG